MLKLPKSLKKDDIEKFFSLVDISQPMGIRNMTALQLMYRTGLRVSEACNLSPSDMLWDDNLVYVQQGKGKKDRYTVLDDTAREWCDRWNEIRPKSDYYLCTKKGTKLNDRYLRRVCYITSDRSHVYINDNHVQKKVHPHNFRHTYAIELLKEGFLLPEIQALLGHGDIKTTMIYTTVAMEEISKKIRSRGR